MRNKDRIFRLIAGSVAVAMVACSDAPTVPTAQADPATSTSNASNPSIPPIPRSLAAQPMLLTYSARGTTADSGLMPFIPRVALAGLVQIDSICDWDYRHFSLPDAPWFHSCATGFWQSISTMNSQMALRRAITVHSDSGCAGYSWGIYRTDSNFVTLYPPYGLLSQAHLQARCGTVAIIPAADGPVYLKHYYRWQNVTSRVLGPGTTYSVTYSWTTGVDSTSGAEMASSFDTSSTSEMNYSQTVAAEAGFESKLLGISAKVSVSATFDENSARTLSSNITKTTNSSATVSTQQSTSETTAVSGRDGYTRVYTVWQLVDEYVYSDSASGKEITVPFIQTTSAFLTGALPAPVNWQPVALIWPNAGHLLQGTNFFAQATTDFSLSASAQRVPSIRFFHASAQ